MVKLEELPEELVAFIDVVEEAMFQSDRVPFNKKLLEKKLTLQRYLLEACEGNTVLAKRLVQLMYERKRYSKE
jgi:hypothetical protein